MIVYKLLTICADGMLAPCWYGSGKKWTDPILAAGSFDTREYFRIPGIHALRYGQDSYSEHPCYAVARCEVPCGTLMFASPWMVRAAKLVITGLRFPKKHSLAVQKAIDYWRWYVDILPLPESNGCSFTWVRLAQNCPAYIIGQGPNWYGEFWPAEATWEFWADKGNAKVRMSARRDKPAIEAQILRRAKKNQSGDFRFTPECKYYAREKMPLNRWHRWLELMSQHYGLNEMLRPWMDYLELVMAGKAVNTFMVVRQNTRESSWKSNQFLHQRAR